MIVWLHLWTLEEKVMSTTEAVIITVIAFFLAAFVCIPFTDTALLVPLFLVAWLLIAAGLAELSDRRRRK